MHANPAKTAVLGPDTGLGRGVSGERLLKLPDFTHLLTVIGTGRDKGVSVVMPNACRWPKGLIVTDKDFGDSKAVSAYGRPDNVDADRRAEEAEA